MATVPTGATEVVVSDLLSRTRTLAPEALEPCWLLNV